MTGRITSVAALAIAMLLLPACVAKTALDVVTMPVKATAQAADWATTSQDEADRNHGRELRKRCAKHYEPEYCDRNQEQR
jgi:hypothetical protein